MSAIVAHKLSGRVRTGDVLINENVDFERLLLSENVLAGLKSAGFERPSPIQLKAIPLGRCGLDLIVQAKSGTGKTCVFAVIALESVIIQSSSTQAIVLAPTREIAVQICEVIKSVGSCVKGLRCHTFIGGMPVSEDKAKLKKCHIAVGTPGRLKQLIEDGILRTESIRMFILDEADKLLEENFQESINWIYSTLPENKQILALSATYPEVLAQHLTAYMRNPTFVRMNATDPALLGIRQYYKAVPFHPLPQKSLENKVDALLELLSSINFSQCLVFSNYQLRAQSLSDMLNKKGWPSAYISGAQDQQDRLSSMDKLKKLKCRVLVSTDLTARGIDAEHVNLVVNVDLPWDHETYLHRIGRAGRFGTYGAGITIVLEGKQTEEMHVIESKCNTTIHKLPEPIPADLAKSSGYVNIDNLVTTEQLITNTTETRDALTKIVTKKLEHNDLEPAEQKSKLGKQSTVLSSLLNNVIDYNKDKILKNKQGKRNPLSMNGVESTSEGKREDFLEPTENIKGSRSERKCSTKASLETKPFAPLVNGGFGDAYIPSLISPSDPYLEAELVDDFKLHMENYECKVGATKVRKSKWSYMKASRSLEEFLDRGDVAEEVPIGSGVTANQDSDETVSDVKPVAGNEEDLSKELVESVSKLLSQVYLKYSNAMIEGTLYGTRPSGLLPLDSARESTGDNAVYGSVPTKCQDIKPRVSTEELKGKLSTDLTKECKPECSPNLLSVKAKKVSTSDESFKTKKSRTTSVKSPKVTKNEAAHNSRSDNRKETNSFYPFSKWEPVVDESKNQTQRAEMLKELEECQRQLSELNKADTSEAHSEESSSEDFSDKYSQSSDEEISDESDWSEGEYTNYETASANSTSEQIHSHYPGTEQHMKSVPDISQYNFTYDKGHSSSWQSQAHTWPYPFPTSALQENSYRVFLTHCYQNAVMSSKYYHGLLVHINQSENLRDHYVTQQQYVKQMSKKS